MNPKYNIIYDFLACSGWTNILSFFVKNQLTTEWKRKNLFLLFLFPLLYLWMKKFLRMLNVTKSIEVDCDIKFKLKKLFFVYHNGIIQGKNHFTELFILVFHAFCSSLCAPYSYVVMFFLLQHLLETIT